MSGCSSATEVEIVKGKNTIRPIGQQPRMGQLQWLVGKERLLLAPPIVGSATQARMGTGAADGLRIRQIPSR